MQLASIEFARHEARIKNATSYEINSSAKDKVVDILPEQKEKMKKGDYGGSMRLGIYPAILKKGTLVRKIYGKEEILERHRHRFELSQNYVEILEKNGLIISGTSPDGKLPEIIELSQKEHPFFLAVQFHPEMQARPLNSHPIFNEFIKVAKNRKK